MKRFYQYLQYSNLDNVSCICLKWILITSIDGVDVQLTQKIDKPLDELTEEEGIIYGDFLLAGGIIEDKVDLQKSLDETI